MVNLLEYVYQRQHGTCHEKMSQQQASYIGNDVHLFGAFLNSFCCSDLKLAMPCSYYFRRTCICDDCICIIQSIFALQKGKEEEFCQQRYSGSQQYSFMNAGRLISYIIFVVKDHLNRCCKLKFAIIHECRLAVSGARKQRLHLFFSVLMLFWFGENEHYLLAQNQSCSIK